MQFQRATDATTVPPTHLPCMPMDSGLHARWSTWPDGDKGSAVPSRERAGPSDLCNVITLPAGGRRRWTPERAPYSTSAAARRVLAMMMRGWMRAGHVSAHVTGSPAPGARLRTCQLSGETDPMLPKASPRSWSAGIYPSQPAGQLGR